MKKRERKNNNKFKNIYLIIFTIITLTFLVFLKLCNILPTLYFIISLVLVILLYTINLILIKNNKKIGYILSALFITIYLIITYYLGITLNFFNSFSKIHYSEETYLVLTLKESNYKDIKDIENKDLGYIKNDLTNINKAIEKLDKKVKTEKKEYTDYTKLFNDLDKKTLSSILIEENYYNIKSEEEDVSQYQILYKITIRSVITEKNKTVDVTKDPFTIYISGIDVYGDIATVSRSDVNILVTVNPKTKQILLTSIPRDYYVQLSGTTGYKDKLTHAGNYGVNMSISTIEELLGIDINYYLRVNFTTLEKLIDSIDGVDVYSKYSFTSYIDNYQFYKGYNHMNSKQALAFSRERKSLPEGDNDRGKNQEAVIEAIIRKVTSKELIYKYSKILSSVKDSFQTSLSETDITKLIQKELENPGGWNITSTSLTGTGSMDYTYSYSAQKLYVTIPNEDSIKEAKKLIDDVNNGITLESSYNNTVGNVKYPNQINPQTTKEETKKDTTTSTKKDDNKSKEDSTKTEKDNTTKVEEKDNQATGTDKDGTTSKDNEKDETIDKNKDEKDNQTSGTDKDETTSKDNEKDETEKANNP